jgi:molybdopterin synthase sulfur carrier subunit
VINGARQNLRRQSKWQMPIQCYTDDEENTQPMPSIKIPTPLRAYTDNQAQVIVSGDTVGAALDSLTTQYPELRQHLYEGDNLRNFVNIFLGDEDVRFLDGLATEIDTNDSLRIIPSIAGGAG